MTRDEALASLDRWYAALLTGDAERIGAAAAADVTVEWYAPEGLFAWSGQWRGPAAVADFLRRVRDEAEVIVFDREEPIVDGSRVVVLARGRWRLRSTGREIAADVANVFELAPDGVRRYRVYNDTAAFAAGLR